MRYFSFSGAGSVMKVSMEKAIFLQDVLKFALIVLETNFEGFTSQLGNSRISTRFTFLCRKFASHIPGFD